MKTEPKLHYTVRRYGVLGAPSPTDAVAEVLRLRRAFWNALVAIERDHRAQVLAIGAESPEAAAWEQARDRVEAMVAELKRRRKEARGRGSWPQLAEEIKLARTERKTAAIAAKEARRVARERQQPLMEALEAKRIAAVKAAYAASGLWWGNYNDVLSEYNAARSAAMRTGSELRFRRASEPGGQLSVLDTSSPLPTARVVAATHPKVTLAPDGTAHVERLRVGSDRPEGVAPMVEARIRLHRPLPDGKLRRAALVRHAVLGKEKWHSVYVVETPEPAPRTCGRTVAVDIGWRRVGDRLRSGYYASDDGSHGEILLPDGIEQAIAKSDDLRSLCDRITNEARERFLAAWASCATNLPPEINGRLKGLHIPQWRSGERLARLFRSWVPVPGDAPIQAAIRLPIRDGRDYATQWMHLARWERHGRDQAIARRRDMPEVGYRTIAKRLLQDARMLVLEHFDLRQMAAKPAPEAAEDDGRRVQQRLAAPGELRAALVAYARREGVEIVEAPAQYTTMRCNACGLLMRYDQERELAHRCERCGDERDQDYTAALNLLQLGGAAGAAATGRSQDGPHDDARKGDMPAAVDVPAQRLGY